MRILKMVFASVLAIIIIAGVSCATPKSNDIAEALPTKKAVPHPIDLPHSTLIVWDDGHWTVDELKKLRSYGFQGVAKIVGVGGWNVVEKAEGSFDFSRLEAFLTRAQEAGFWAFPAISMNTPPDWFVSKYPECVMKDAHGNTVVTVYSSNDGKILSPWFMAGKTGDFYIKRYISQFLSTIKKYPNVIGVFVGNEAGWIFNRPWRFGDSPDLTYFSCFDDYALATYKRDIASKYPAFPNPPKTYEDVIERGPNFKTDFERWYQSAAVKAIDKYLGWIDGGVKYKIVNVGRLGFDQHNYMLGTTDYQIRSVFSAMANHSGTIENFEALDSSDIVCREIAGMASDAGIIFGGEPVGGSADSANFPIALRNLADVGGQIIFGIAFNNDLPRLSTEIMKFNSRFLWVPPPPLPNEE